MDREQWWKGLVPILQSFADAAYQRRALLVPSPNATTPVEMYCQLFDDLEFERFQDIYGESSTPEQTVSWAAFAQALDDCSQRIDDLAIQPSF
jgi:hypothetical protein